MPGETSGQSRDRDDRVDDAVAEYLQRIDAGEQVDPEVFIAQYPGLESSLREFLDNLRGQPVRRACRRGSVRLCGAYRRGCRCPWPQTTPKTIPPPQTNPGRPEQIPTQIGRFQIKRLLGTGGFGAVYLAHDPQLQRNVALKVPNRQRLAADQRVEVFLAEARAAARLRHPGLVQVHDVQQDGDDVYIVHEYIAGQDLMRWAAATRPPANKWSH